MAEKSHRLSLEDYARSVLDLLRNQGSGAGDTTDPAGPLDKSNTYELNARAPEGYSKAGDPTASPFDSERFGPPAYPNPDLKNANAPHQPNNARGAIEQQMGIPPATGPGNPSPVINDYQSVNPAGPLGGEAQPYRNESNPPDAGSAGMKLVGVGMPETQDGELPAGFTKGPSKKYDRYTLPAAPPGTSAKDRAPYDQARRADIIGGQNRPFEFINETGKDGNHRLFESKANAWYAYPPVGASAVAKNSEFIDKSAQENNIDPALLKSLIYYENAHGWYDIADPNNKSMRPGNVKAEWLSLMPGMNEDELRHDPAKNIELTARILAGIKARLKNPTPEAIATLYNGLSYGRVSGYGLGVTDYMVQKPWENFGHRRFR